MKKFLFNGIFLIAICLSACTDKAVNEVSNDPTEYPTLSAGDILNNLGNSFKIQTRAANADSDFAYPDYYGGGYLDTDGNVVVLVKGEPQKFMNEFQTRTLSNNVIVKKCQYSYNELVELNNQLIKVFSDETTRNELQWTSIGIDTEKNKVIIGLINCTENAKNKFKNKVSNSDAIDFKEGGEGTLDASANLAGKVSYLSVGGSIGYRAKNSAGSSGFVTAGHFVPKINGAVYIEGNYGADCKNTQYSGTFDAAFCQLRSGYSISSTTQYGKVTVKAELVPLANMKNTTIVMEGRSTAKASEGVVSEISASQVFTKELPGIGYKTYSISNLIFSSYPSAGGDSGGTVYDKASSKVVGIHTGRLLQNKVFKGSYTSYAGNINSTYKLTLE